MPQAVCHCFSVKFVMLYQMVCYIFLTALQSQTLLLIGDIFSRANQDHPNPPNTWFQKATQRAKLLIPCERALQTGLKNSVRLFVAFCLTYLIV